MNLDMRTIVLCHSLVNMVLTLILLFGWRQSRNRSRGLLFWVISFACITVGEFLTVFRGFIPDEISILAANIIVFTGFFFLSHGITVFLEKKTPLLFGLLVLGAGIVHYSFFSMVWPNLQIRIVGYNIIAICFSLYNMIMLIRLSPKSRKTAGRLAGALSGILTSLFSVRLVWNLISNPGSDLMAVGNLEVIFLMLCSVLFTGFVFSLLQMVNFRLQNELESTAEKLEQLATRDSLTGVYNRRKFSELAEREFVRFKRYKQVCTLVVVDVDNLKTINDTAGHLAGDEVLVRFATIVRRNLRESDVFGRFGGDEFNLLLIESNKDETMKTLERIRDESGRESIEFMDETINFTISAGVAEFDEVHLTLDDVFIAADTALYLAKEKGKNKIVSA